MLKTDSSQDARNCPFCDGDRFSGYKSAITGFYSLHCTKCGITTPSFSTKEELLKYWNGGVVVEKPESAEKEPDVREQLFDEFWSLYPRHVGKAQAKKAFFAIKNVEKVFPKIKLTIEKQILSGVVLVKDEQFVPYPASWIHKKFWEDDIEQVKDSPYDTFIMTGNSAKYKGE